MASNLLWAHLLRKDATSADSPSQIPPIAPHDKTGTSVRMLIHDTHVNLEKFSTRVDDLLQRVDNCRTQVVNANKLLDVERDKVVSEILEIANRCQAEMKTHVGTPAQAPALELLKVSQTSTEQSLQALEKRIDALQALLEMQAHTMQSIQNQQNSLLGTILPLVSIIHGIPAQIDHVKVTLSDMVEKSISTTTKSVESVRLSLLAEIARGESPTRVGSSSKSTSSSRHERWNASVVCAENTHVPASPLGARGQEVHHRLGLKRTRMEAAADHASDAQSPRKLSRMIVPQQNPGDPLPTLQTLRTLRRPLADIILPPGNGVLRVQNLATDPLDSTSRGCMRLEENCAATGPLPLEIAPPDSHDATIHRRDNIPFTVDKPTMTPPSTAKPLDQDVLSKAMKIEEILEANFTDVISIHSSPLSSPPSSMPLVAAHLPGETTAVTAQPSQHLPFHPRDNVPDAVQEEPDRAPSVNRFAPNIDGSPHKPMSLRDRRAQISRFGRTQTRRFVPLVPWSDEEE